MVVALYTFIFCQIVVEIMVAEVGTVIAKHSDVFPFQFKAHIGSLRLLLDTLMYALLRITYFQPSIVTCYLRSTVSIHHPDKAVEAVNSRCVHHWLFVFFS